MPKIVQVRHHDAHAAMFFVSPFEEAAVAVMDAYGDETAQSVYIGSGNRLQRLWQGEFFDSLGMLYTAVTTHLGFKVFEEGTVMALAAAGGPTYEKRFRELIHFLPDGRFSVNRDFVSYDTHGLNKPFKQRFTRCVRATAPASRAPHRSSPRSCLRAAGGNRRYRPPHRPRAVEAPPVAQFVFDRWRGAELRGERAHPARYGLSLSVGAAVRVGFGRIPGERALAPSSDARPTARL